MVSPPSCSSRPFHFSQQHPLIATKGFTWATFDNPHFISDPYNLEDLFSTVGFDESARDRISEEVTSSKNLGCGRHPIAWVKSLIDNSRRSDTAALSYTANVAVKAMQDGLVSFMYSTRNRPDGVLLRSFQCNGKEWQLPLLILEEHFSPYKNTVSQTAADVLEQFRLLRCFNPNIRECVGFTFPKYATTESTHKTCVTKVTVGFEDFQFVIRLTPLAKDEVQNEIQGACKAALKFQASYPEFSFLRLSTAEMSIAFEAFGVNDIEQHPSKHSIVLKSVSAKKFFKCIPCVLQS